MSSDPTLDTKFDRGKLITDEDLVPVDVAEGVQLAFQHTPTMTLAKWKFSAGTILDRHSHPQEQLISVESGKLQVTIGLQTYELKAGERIAIPPNLEHEALAITDCEVTDIFSPRREEYDSLGIHNISVKTDPISSISCNTIDLSTQGYATLSNFGQTPFLVNGICFDSIEVFTQFIKLHSENSIKDDIPQYFALKAQGALQEYNEKIASELDKGRNVPIYWGNFTYNYHSFEHNALIKKALLAKFLQNTDAKEILLSTEDSIIRISAPHPEGTYASLSRSELINYLTKIRSILKNGFVDLSRTSNENMALQIDYEAPFEFYGKKFQSTLAFLVYIRINEDIERETILTMSPDELRTVEEYLDNKLFDDLKAGREVFVELGDTKTPYGSSEHHDLLALSILEKFKYNPKAKAKLIATGSRYIVNLSQNRTIGHIAVDESMYTELLNDIKDELFEA